MDFIQDNELPEIVKSHLGASVSKVWQSQEKSAYTSLSSEFGIEKVLNAFKYLKAHGIPPYGEISNEPFGFLASHPLLIIAFNIGYRVQTKVLGHRSVNESELT